MSSCKLLLSSIRIQISGVVEERKVWFGLEVERFLNALLGSLC